MRITTKTFDNQPTNLLYRNTDTDTDTDNSESESGKWEVESEDINLHLNLLNLNHKIPLTTVPCKKYFHRIHNMPTN